MRVYHRQVIGGTFAAGGSGSWVALLPASAPTAAVKTIAGVTVQTLTSALDAVAARYYISTTDALYTTGTLYVPTWSVNIAGTTYTTTGYYQHVTAGTSGPATGAATIGTPSLGEESLTVPQTPPTDATYSYTTIYAIPVHGGTTVTASGSGSLITLSGLSASVLYTLVAIAYSTGGAASVLSNVMLAQTLPAHEIAMPAYLKWWVNDEVAMHEHGPEAFDPSVSGDRTFTDLGRGRTWSLMIECHEPVWFGVRGIGGVMTVPGGEPGGLRDDKGT